MTSLQSNGPVDGASARPRRGPVIVGIGASAGGLEALEQLFALLPANGGLAYVVIQHLAPKHESMLVELLARRTAVPVVEAPHGAIPQPDHVYVIAPGSVLTLSGGAFHSAPIEGEGRGQIDAFLRSLAEDRAERAIGVLLSGSGSDGTEGLRAIKERGGLTLAQAPGTARYDSMPRSAIDAGVVAQVLPIEAMPARLIEHARDVDLGRPWIATPPAEPPKPEPPAPSDEELAACLERVFGILQRATGHDFSQYKRGTVLRRLRLRLHLRRPASLAEYLALLDAEPHEAEALAKDLLISVTQFFRDPQAFDHLGAHVLPEILASARGEGGVRIWVPGCASGEEAYSIAILLHEQLAGVSPAPHVQIFATDIDRDAIAEARLGRYSADIARHVSAERLGRFFTQEGSSYQVTRNIRGMCVFSEHSLIRDPPFLSLDLISCRNLLIYLDAALQKKLVPLFHYALRRGGRLFLGPSEGLAGNTELFEAESKPFRIFRRNEVAVPPRIELPLGGTPPRTLLPLPAPAPASVAEPVAGTAFERLILHEYAAPAALVNENGDILAVTGLAGRYLQPAAGILAANVFDIAQASLRIELRTALHAAVRSGRRVVREGVPIDVEGAPPSLRLTVRPVPSHQPGGLFAVVFQERPGAADSGLTEPGEPAATSTGAASAMEQLEHELRTTRASLRSTIEQLESTNEELRASNEELLSTNEEMQSANEELQSSQEELRSVNEELVTVNGELGRKVDELGQANSDLANLFQSTETATIFLDREQRVTRFTPAAKALFRLIDADAGRPLADLAPRFLDHDIAADVSEVLRTLQSIERSVVTVDRATWYLLRVLPYRTTEHVVAGAVVTLADITRIKRAEIEREQLHAELSRAHAQSNADLDAMSRLQRIGTLFLRESLDVVLGEILDAALAIAGADFGYIQLLDSATGDLKIAVHRGFPAFWVESWDRTQRGQGTGGTALQRMERVIVEDIETSPLFAGTPALDMQRSAGVRAVQSTPVVGRADAPLGILSTHWRRPGPPGDRALQWLGLVARQLADVLQRAHAEEKIKKSEARFRALVEASSDVLFRVSPDWTEMRQLHSRGSLTSTETASRTWLQDYIPPEDQPRFMAAIQETLRNKGVFELEHRIRRADSELGWTLSRAVPVMDEGGEIIEWFGAASDITARKAAELALEEANVRLREADQRKNDFIGMLSHELRNPLAPIRNALDTLNRASPGSEHANRAQAVIRRQVDHLTHMIEDLLDVTRIASGKIHLRREPLDLADLARRVVEDYRGQFVKKGVALELAEPPPGARVSGDRTRLSQAIGNLLQNAVKFTPAGGRATVSVEKDAAGGRVMVRVTDTGRGIAPELLPRVFEVFTQADTSIDRSMGGLGLGLSVVKGLVELHGGTVTAASEGTGKGAAFTIELPLVEAPASEVSEPAPAPQEAGRRVLIIDDNVDGTESLRDLLDLEGHTVAVASNGPEGIERARAFRPHVVLCDIGLPGMDGYAVARAMRADPALRDIKLVALSGYTAAKDVAASREAGFDVHLPKPPRAVALAAALSGGRE